MNITQTPEPATVRPTRRIGTFDMMVVVEESHTDSLEITQHPVQEGAEVSDHAYLKATSVNVRAVFNDETMPLEDLYTALRDFQAEREPFDVVTGKRIYKNMLIKTLGVTTDKDKENILAVNFELQEVIIVSVEVATVPPRSKQKSPAKTSGTQNAGSKSAKEDTSKNEPKKRQSILRSAKPLFGG